MDLRSLRYYVSAVNEGSISGAAQMCHVAQPSITLAISKLEDEFDCQLLERHRKGVNTTEKGQQLYDMAIELLQHASSIESKFKTITSPTRLKLAISPSIQVSYVEKIVAATKNLELPLEFMISEHIDGADLTLCTKSQIKTNRTFYPIATERYCVLMPASNRLAHQQTIKLKDLNQLPLIERSACENRPLFEQVMKQLKLDLSVSARVDNEEWAMALVAAGIGISISPLPIGFKDPRFIVRNLSELIHMKTPERQVGLSINKNLSAEIQEVLDQVSHYFTNREFS